MFKDELRKYVEENSSLVSMKESIAYPGLFVLKYSRKVFFKGLWNEYLEECRGTIVDADFNVVSRPFTKIYNYGVEASAPVFDIDTVVTAYRKVNGFMAALTWYKDDILVSTTGSTDSDFVGYVKEMMLTHQSWDAWRGEVRTAKGHTLMFECVHPVDPHICPEDAGMYFLGVRENAWDSSVNAYGQDMINWSRSYATSNLQCKYAEGEMMTVGQLVKRSKYAKHEGFVFYAEDGRGAKIKTKYYLVQKALARKKDIMSLNKEWLDEEFYPMVDHLNSIKDQFNALDEQARLEYMRNYLEAA